MREAAPHPDERVGVVVAQGAIVDGDQPAGVVGGDTAALLIRQARENDAIKALVLRVDSPGGSAFASEVIRRELELTRKAGQLFGLPTAANAPERDWPDEIVSVAVQNDRSIRPPSSVQQNVPAWLVFAMFFVVIPINHMMARMGMEGRIEGK